jgi:hypothetical protein
VAKTNKQKKGRGAEAGTMIAGTPLLSPAGKLLATTFALPLAARAIPVYPMADRRRLIDQLTLALGSFYVHLNRKKAIYGFDPVRALALLALKVDTMSDAEFHENLVELLGRVRDRHVIFLGRALRRRRNGALHHRDLLGKRHSGLCRDQA